LGDKDLLSFLNNRADCILTNFFAPLATIAQMSKLNAHNNKWLLAPGWGILFFIALYVIASFYYPGGSQVDKASVGFSWINNYWCNLLDKKSIDGQINGARPIAAIAMVFLCFSLSLFWYLLPLIIYVGRHLKGMIQITGVLSMVSSFLLFFPVNHDFAINLSSFLGLIACAGTLVVLLKSGRRVLFFFGILNLLLIALNNYLYYSSDLIIYLPMVQKITFLLFLIWIVLIDYFVVYRLANKFSGKFG
jgi:hypothetical protein